MSYLGNKDLEVFIDLGGIRTKVGALVLSERSIYFRYDMDYLSNGYNISPFKLKFDDSIQSCDLSFFEGLFGVFHDSLPDGWGRLLLDRYLGEEGVLPGEINILDRLTFIGAEGKGTLSYFPNALLKQKKGYLSIDQYYQEAIKIYDGVDSDQISELFLAAGSSGGARPKLHCLRNANTGKIHVSQISNDPYENWIIKFASSQDIESIAEVEYAYYKMAVAAGVEMSSSLLYREGDTSYFATKRFDKQPDEKFHMISAAGLLHDNYRYTSIDYGHLMDVAYKLTKDMQQVKSVLRLGIFNVLSHNLDDHSRNFSFLMNKSGVWKVAPAYDLTYSNTPHAFHSTTLAGKSKDFVYEDFQELARDFSIDDLGIIYEEVATAVMSFATIAYGVKPQVKSMIQSTIARINRDIKPTIL